MGNYYDKANKVDSSELRNRLDSEAYCDEYKRVCAKILLKRGNITEEEFDKFTKNIGGGKTCEQGWGVPDTLEECYRKDKVYQDILKLSVSIEIVGRIIFVILLLLGVAEYFISSYAIYEEFDVKLFSAHMTKYIIYAFIEYYSVTFMAKMLAGLASIVQSNKVTSKVALYMAKFI